MTEPRYQHIAIRADVLVEALRTGVEGLADGRVANLWLEDGHALPGWQWLHVIVETDDPNVGFLVAAGGHVDSSTVVKDVVTGGFRVLP